MSNEAKWPIYSLGLKARAEVAERTLELRFDKPATMTFKAGQFMDLTLLDPPETDAELYDRVRQHFSEEEIVNLTMAVIAINGWNRLAIPFRSVPGSYQPPARAARGT